MLKELRDKERRMKLRWTGNQTVSLPCGVFINTFHSEFSRKGKTLITYSVQHGGSATPDKTHPEGAVSSDCTYGPPPDLSQCQLTKCPKSLYNLYS